MHEVGPHAQGVGSVVVEQCRRTVEHVAALLRVGVLEEQLIGPGHHLALAFLLAERVGRRLAVVGKEHMVGRSLPEGVRQALRFGLKNRCGVTFYVPHQVREAPHRGNLEIGAVQPRLLVEHVGQQQLVGFLAVEVAQLKHLSENNRQLLLDAQELQSVMIEHQALCETQPMKRPLLHQMGFVGVDLAVGFATLVTPYGHPRIDGPCK